MQLTKKDVLRIAGTPDYLDYSKFQQVVAFYETTIKLWNNRVTSFYDTPVWKQCKKDLGDTPITHEVFLNWLFSYCFKDGLK